MSNQDHKDNYTKNEIFTHIELVSEVASYPFCAVVGQDLAKLALLIGCLEPTIGGVLLKGHKGSAKTTLARSLPGLLGANVPFVNLPLSVTEDRLIGSIDISALVNEGKERLKPGLLAIAHNGVLYVDEVNLLADYIVDMLLDVAATQVNTVERDGISISHRSKFILIGSMNPEEGGLRPQLADRFGLSVDVNLGSDPSERLEIVNRRLAFEKDRIGFLKTYEPKQEALKTFLKSYKPARVSKNISLYAIKEIVKFGCESARAELVLLKSARALSYLMGSSLVVKEHIDLLIPLVISHRVHNNSLKYADNISRSNESNLADSKNDCSGVSGEDSNENSRGNKNEKNKDKHKTENWNTIEDLLDLNLASVFNKGGYEPGKSPKYENVEKLGGRTIGIETEGLTPMHAYATAVEFSKRISKDPQNSGGIELSDLRYVSKKTNSTNHSVILLDTSHSMSGSNKLKIVKSTVYELLKNAHKTKDVISIITFSSKGITHLVTKSSSFELVDLKLTSLEFGGKTPLFKALYEVISWRENELSKDKKPHLLVVSDCKNTVAAEDFDRETLAQNLKKHFREIFILNPTNAGKFAGEEMASLLGAMHIIVENIGQTSTLVTSMIRECS